MVHRSGSPSGRAVLAAAGVGALVVLMTAGCTSQAATSKPAGSTGPGNGASSSATAIARPHSDLTGSIARPAFTSEGDSVVVKLGRARVRMTVVGPEVPGEGLPYQGETTTCTWTVTVSSTGASVPLDLTQLSTLDHLGATAPLALAPGQPILPAAVADGQSVTFTVRSVMRVGQGVIRWAPDTRHIVALWDFEVEND